MYIKNDATVIINTEKTSLTRTRFTAYSNPVFVSREIKSLQIIILRIWVFSGCIMNSYEVSTHWNSHNEAMLMSEHNILLFYRNWTHGLILSYYDLQFYFTYVIVPRRTHSTSNYLKFEQVSRCRKCSSYWRLSVFHLSNDILALNILVYLLLCWILHFESSLFYVFHYMYHVSGFWRGANGLICRWMPH